MLKSAARKVKQPAFGVGETWFVRIRGAATLATVRIDEVTELTVCLWLERDGVVAYDGHLGRYARKDLEFVERLK